MSVFSPGISLHPEVCLTSAERRLVRAVLSTRTDRRGVSAAQRSILFEICASSTRRSHAPEEFLVAFKNAVFEEVDALGIPFDGERNDIISHLVSALIEEMFNPAIVAASSATVELRN